MTEKAEEEEKQRLSYTKSEPDSDSESGSTVSSSPSSEMTEKELKSQVQNLRERIQINSGDFQAWLELVRLLRRAGELDDLRQARQQFADRFPLPFEVWREWLTDEEKLACTPEQRLQVTLLYQRAVKDYLVVDLWVDYTRWMETCAAKTDEAATETAGQTEAEKTALNVTDKDVRDVYEQAVSACAHHVGQGLRVWRAYIAYITRIAPADTSHIRTLYKRALSLPYVGLEKLWNEFKEWEQSAATPPSTSTEASACNTESWESLYRKTLAELEQRLPFENKISDSLDVLNPDYQQLPVWREYLAFEEAQKHVVPGRVRCLYERALRNFCLVVDLWQSYTAYMERTFSNVPKLVCEVYARAVRNYPWSADLWSSYLRALHRSKCAQSELDENFEVALQAGLQNGADYVTLFLSYIDLHLFTVRATLTTTSNAPSNDTAVATLRSSLQRAVDYLSQMFPDSVTDIEKYWAYVEAHVLGDASASRTHWERIVNKFPHSTDLRLWIEYIHMEQKFGTPAKVSSLFKRAHHIACTSIVSLLSGDDATQTAAQRSQVDLVPWLEWLWLMHERSHGSVEDLELAEQRIRTRIQQQQQQQHEEQQQQQQQQQQQKRRSKFTETRRGQKRKASETEDNKSTIKEGTKRRKFTRRGAVRFDPCVIHVSNLPVESSLDEDTLQRLFAPFGTVRSVHLVRDKNNQFKGFAYVEFSSPTEAERALQVESPLTLHDHILQLQPAIALHLPSSLSSSSSLDATPTTTTTLNFTKSHVHSDKLTVFISMLSFRTSQASLETHIKKVAPNGLLAVRLILDKATGRSRGFAYADYDNEEHLEEAVKKLNEGPLLDGWRLKAAKSDPSVSVKSRHQIAPQSQGDVVDSSSNAKQNEGIPTTETQASPQNLQEAESTKTTSIESQTMTSHLETPKRLMVPRVLASKQKK
jgi:RNA recognition motif-containing protein